MIYWLNGNYQLAENVVHHTWMFVTLRNLLWKSICRPSGSFPFNTVESNSVDPDESSLYVASHLGWYCVQFPTSKLDRGLLL